MAAKKHKFKVGDIVRVRAWEDMEKEYGVLSDGNISFGKDYPYFDVAMKRHCGKEYKVTLVGVISLSLCSLRNGCEIKWMFCPQMLEPVFEQVEEPVDFQVGDRITVAIFNALVKRGDCGTVAKVNKNELSVNMEDGAFLCLKKAWCEKMESDRQDGPIQESADIALSDTARGDEKKKDHGKLMWDLLPLNLVENVVKVLTMAVESGKYQPNSWQLIDDPKNRYFAAMMRHIEAYQSGELADPESGLAHMAHVMTNAMFLLHFQGDEK